MADTKTECCKCGFRRVFLEYVIRTMALFGEDVSKCPEGGEHEWAETPKGAP